MTQPATRIDTAALDPLESASVDELRATQVKRLKWSLKHAYENVAFYRQSFDKAGIHPDDIQSLEDLAKLPFTTKADLRDNYPFGMLATPMSEIVRIHASSGTTGQPTVVGYTQKDIDVWSEVVVDPRCRRQPPRQGACGVWLRSVYRWARRALRCRTPGLCRHPHVGRPDREAGSADP